MGERKEGGRIVKCERKSGRRKMRKWQGGGGERKERRERKSEGEMERIWR